MHIGNRNTSGSVCVCLPIFALGLSVALLTLSCTDNGNLNNNDLSASGTPWLDFDFSVIGQPTLTSEIQATKRIGLSTARITVVGDVCDYTDYPYPLPTSTTTKSLKNETRSNTAHSAGWTGAGVKMLVVDTYFSSGTPALVDLTRVNHGTIVMSTAQALARNADFVPVTWQGAGTQNERLLADSRNNPSGWINEDIETDFTVSNHSYGLSTGNRYLVYCLIEGNSRSNYRDRQYGIKQVIVRAAGNESLPSDTDPPPTPNTRDVASATPSDTSALVANYIIGRNHEFSGVLVVGSVNENTNRLSDNSFRAGFFASIFIVTTAFADSGTSFASPIVAGAVAMLQQKYPRLTAGQISYILLTSADDLGPAGVDPVYGHGRLNLDKAFDLAEQIRSGAHTPVEREQFTLPVITIPENACPAA